jgi:hypothetical protein
VTETKTPAQRRRRLKKAAAAICDNTFPFLDVMDKAAVAELIETVLAGYDARLKLSIERKRGKLPRNTAKHKSMAGVYLARLEAGEHEKTVASDLAKRHAVTAQFVRDTAREKREAVNQLAKQIGWDGVLYYAVAFHPTQRPSIKQITRNEIT